MNNRLKRIITAMLAFVVLLSVPVYAADSGAGTMTSSDRTFIASGLSYHSRTFGEKDGMSQRTAAFRVDALRTPSFQPSIRR